MLSPGFRTRFVLALGLLFVGIAPSVRLPGTASLVLADEAADPNFPRPSGAVKTTSGHTITWMYVKNKVLLTVDGKRKPYLGYDASGSFLNDYEDNGTLLADGNGNYSTASFRFNRATNELTIFGSPRIPDYKYPPPPNDLDARFKTLGDDTEWCEIDKQCGNAQVRRDANRQFLLTYSGDMDEADGLRSVHVCRMTAPEPSMPPAMAALFKQMAKQAEDARLRYGMTATPAPVPTATDEPPGEYISVPDQLHDPRLDYNVAGGVVTWRSISSARIAALEADGKVCAKK